MGIQKTPTIGKMIKVRYSPEETGWAQVLSATTVRLANIPDTKRLNVDDITEIDYSETDNDDLPVIGDVLHNIFEHKTVIGYEHTADFYKLETLFELLGCKVEGNSVPKNNKPGKACVAFKDHIDVNGFLESIGMPNQWEGEDVDEVE